MVSAVRNFFPCLELWRRAYKKIYRPLQSENLMQIENATKNTDNWNLNDGYIIWRVPFNFALSNTIHSAYLTKKESSLHFLISHVFTLIFFSPRIQKSKGINTQTYRRCNLKMHRDEKKRKIKHEYFNKECSILSIFVMGNKCRLRKHFSRTICANKTVVGLKTHAKKWTIAHYSLAKIITRIGFGLASSSHSKGHAFSNSFCSLRHSSNSFVW